MFDKYYTLLEISNHASDEEIKKAYRKMALLYHPDKQNGKTETEQQEAEVKFKEIAEAYEILTNKEKYMNKPNIGTNGFNGANGFKREFFDPTEIFNQLFKDINISNSNSRRQVHIGIRPNNLHIRRNITQSSISIVNGRRIETIVQTVNGVTSQRTIVSGANINSGVFNIHIR